MLQMGCHKGFKPNLKNSERKKNIKIVFNTLKEAATYINMYLSGMEETYERKLPFIINDEDEKFFFQY